MKPYEGKKAALHTLGCKVNAYETDSMAALLRDAGYEIVPFSEKADVYVINTCSVTNIADRKSRQMIHRARKENPAAVIVAAGCYVQTAVDKTGLSVDADIILGTGRKKDLVREIDRFEKNRFTQIRDVDDLKNRRISENLILPKVEGRTRAYIKVQDGCDMYCSYCIIPYARGHVRSRKKEDILAELTHLAEEGTREIVLTGIHLSSYGVDFSDVFDVPSARMNPAGPHNEPQTACGKDMSSETDRCRQDRNRTASKWQERSKLADLIESVSQIGGIRRIRLGSLEPTIVTEEFAERLSGVESLCPHFHLSLQSGSDSVLKRMNRHYTTEDYRKCVGILRKWFDDPAITTDVIVGFPGETEEEFGDTVRFLKEIHLYETHIFRYSRRAGTRADRMDGQIAESVKAERAAVLEKLNEQNRRAYILGKNGKREEVLAEEAGSKKIPNAARLRPETEAPDDAGSQRQSGKKAAAYMQNAQAKQAAAHMQNAQAGQAAAHMQNAQAGQAAASAYREGEIAAVLFPDRGVVQSHPTAWYAGYTRDYIRVMIPSDTDIRGQIISGTLKVADHI